MSLLQFLKNDRGGISILTALTGAVMIGFAGLAVDVGAVYLDSRRLQGDADLAALAAVQSPSNAALVARETIEANHWTNPRITTTQGVYLADRSVQVNQRFRPNATGANAVRVEVTATTPLFFARIFVPEGQMTITRRATAAQRQLASFQIGSRLLSLRGGIANALLGGLTGSSVNLSVMDYNALISANVDLLTFVDALRTRLDPEAASYDRTLETEIESGVVLDTLANLLAPQDRQASEAMRELAEAASDSERTLELGKLIDIGPYAQQDQSPSADGLGISVSAMDLASAVLQIAGGERQVQLDLGAGVPGLASTRLWLAIGERPNNSPWLTVTDDDSVVVRTAQSRLYLEASVNAAGLGSVRIPLLVELASGQARLDSIECTGAPHNRAVTLEVAPSVGAISLGEIDMSNLNNFRRTMTTTPAQLVRTSLLRVQAHSHIDVGGEEWNRVRFTQREIDDGVIKTVATRNIVQATVSTLLRNANVEVRTLGIGLNVSVITSLVASVLSAVTAPLDSLVNGITDLLGLSLGEADVRVNGISCGGVALVA
ncbi:MAG: pilus assembly protein TadG-related protein [Caulobacterales bacterium]